VRLADKCWQEGELIKVKRDLKLHSKKGSATK